MNPFRKAFTLIEMVLVIAVIAVLVALILPAIVPAIRPHPRVSNPQIPAFPWPPPSESAFYVIDQALLSDDKNRTLGGIALALETALNSAGYAERSYYSVPNGFALAARLEQVNEDGTSMDLPQRWSAGIEPPDKFTLESYLKALFSANKGYYRLIVFIVTDVPLRGGDGAATKKEADEWVWKGAKTLPRDLSAKAAGEDCVVTALIYEFEQQSRDHDVTFHKPGRLNGKAHINQAKLFSHAGD